jgi:hypothetical protein
MQPGLGCICQRFSNAPFTMSVLLSPDVGTVHDTVHIYARKDLEACTSDELEGWEWKYTDRFLGIQACAPPLTRMHTGAPLASV